MSVNEVVALGTLPELNEEFSIDGYQAVGEDTCDIFSRIRRSCEFPDGGQQLDEIRAELLGSPRLDRLFPEDTSSYLC